MSLTLSQKNAIEARGDVLVVAGAGTGKTKTLVERCLGCLLDAKNPASIDEILVVTFTDAAASEVRQRIRGELEKSARKAATEGNFAGAQRWQEQLALFETAHIGTLHSFCLRLIKQHFYQLDIDPQLAVLPEEEANLLATEIFDSIFNAHYAGETENAAEIEKLILLQGGGSDSLIRSLVSDLHKYSQTLPNPTEWVDARLNEFAQPKPLIWEQWFANALADWRGRWTPRLAELATSNAVASSCLDAIKSAAPELSRNNAREVFQALSALDQDYPRGKKTLWREPLEKFFADAEFLKSLCSRTGCADPLAEDWDWIRGHMMALLQLARQFTSRFSEAKREMGMLDFQDLEQYALQLLWNSQTNEPTAVAEVWRKKLHYVFVDEYQDINRAQDKIIEALGRESSHGNRFLVGDAKQSIYRFRLADPHIFQNYVEQWSSPRATSISLLENFRSRKGILHFVNSVFELVMRRELGGVAYDERAQLVFGGGLKTEKDAPTSAPVEMHICIKGMDADSGDSSNSESGDEEVELGQTEIEARFIAGRLLELQRQSYQILDRENEQFRPVEWRDMAILLRSPSGKAEIFAKEFAKLEVPLSVERGGFYQSLEISDLLGLLKLLDNPLQDIPLLAVLRSPLVGLNLNELASIRLSTRARYWNALTCWHKAQSSRRSAAAPSQNGVGQGTTADTWRKVDTFITRYRRWRRLSRQTSLSNCLEAILSETHYASWLLTQPRGRQRSANVRRLFGLAQQFDQFKKQGLFRFLCFVEAQESADVQPEVAPHSDTNAVRLLSIHQSKGLEFPIVVVADLGKKFNFQDLRAEIVFDESFGLCSYVRPPQSGKRYPSLPYWLARERQKNEILGEEVRLLYVAMTRARDLLILTSSVSQKSFEKFWQSDALPDLEMLSSATTYADWIGCWFASSPAAPNATEGEHDSCRWRTYSDQAWKTEVAPATLPATSTISPLAAEDSMFEELLHRMAWQYPSLAATTQTAKSSVTRLRKQVAEIDDGETLPLFKGTDDRRSLRALSQPRASLDSAAELGRLYHQFLQLVDLEQAGSAAGLKAELQRLVAEKYFNVEEAGKINLAALGSFWNSELGREIRAHAKFVLRELPFTARFTPAELAAITGANTNTLADDFAIVQGVADLVVCRPHDLWVIDFKTDRVDEASLSERASTYAPQLRLYGRALSSIYRRPVSRLILYFLHMSKHVTVPAEPSAIAIPMDQ